jgi:hypothetical protein
MNFTANADRGEEKNVVEKLRYQWIQFILEQTGADLEDCFSESGDPEDATILQKALLRKKLDQNKITVKDIHDGSLEIYVEEERIAYWNKPYFRLRIDNNKINKKNQQYIEIDMGCWSIFDEE